MKDRDRFQESDPNQLLRRSFVNLLRKDAPKAGKYVIDIDICGPVSREGDNLIGIISAFPDQGGNYDLIYTGPTDVWNARIDDAGNVSELKGITKEGFDIGLSFLIEPNTPLDTPMWHVTTIEVSEQEGIVALPEAEGFFLGTPINKDIHVGGVAIHYLE